MNRILCILAATLCFILAGCSDGGGDYSDAASLIAYDMPEGWHLHSESSGMRFLRVEEGDRSTLVVKADPRPGNEDIESRRQLGKSQIDAQGASPTTDRTYNQNGFSIWHTQFRLANVSVASWYLYKGDVRIEVKLMAEPDRHDTYLADVQSVVDSIRVR
jgi:hypothetical protein